LPNHAAVYALNEVPMQTNPVEKLRVVLPDEPGRTQPARVALSEVERRAVAALVAEADANTVIAQVTSRATALASPGGPAVRRRSISKAVAVLDAQLAQLTLLLGHAVARRDVEAVQLLDRVATGVTKRLCALLEQHRFEETRGLRTAVMVSHAGQVTVEAGR
jgi:hypothetical protein